MRKKSVFVLVIVLFALAFVNAQIAPTPTQIELPFLPTPDFSKLTAYPVVRIVDGDTIVVSDKGKDVKVGLVGVDTPEAVHVTKPVEHYGKEASRFTTNLLKGEKVYLVGEPLPRTLDRYGRLLVYVYRAPEGLFVNAEIIRQGYGHAYTQIPSKYMKEFKQLEQFAWKAEKGLWAPVPRLAKVDDTEDFYSCEGNFDARHPCSNAVDEDWDSYVLAAEPGVGSYIYENYIIPSGITMADFTIKYAQTAPVTPGGCTNVTDYWDGSWKALECTALSNDISTLTVKIPDDALSRRTLQLRTLVWKSSGIIGSGSGMYYEGKITWYFSL